MRMHAVRCFLASDMTRVIHSEAFSAERTAKTGDREAIKRALAVVQEKADIFTKMIPWPALAASFQRDVILLSEALASKEESK